MPHACFPATFQSIGEHLKNSSETPLSRVPVVVTYVYFRFLDDMPVLS